MILFLRNQYNKTIVDLECYVKTEYIGEPTPMKFVEISVDVAIDTYSHFLLDNFQRKDEIIADFSDINELRGWLWERYFMGGDNDPNKYNDVIQILRGRLQEVANKYNLKYVED